MFAPHCKFWWVINNIMRGEVDSLQVVLPASYQKINKPTPILH